MSVYGTGRMSLNAPQIFLQVCLPGLSAWPKPRGTVRFQSPYVLQPPVTSDGAGVTPRSLLGLICEYGIINPFSIVCASRLPLRSRLTLSRLTSLRKPWVFGVDISISIIVTYAYIFFSNRSSKPHGSPSTLVGMLSYHAYYYAS